MYEGERFGVKKHFIFWEEYVDHLNEIAKRRWYLGISENAIMNNCYVQKFPKSVDNLE